MAAGEEELLHRGRFLELLRRGSWEFVRRFGARGAVHVLAVTGQQEIVLVEQFRVPVDCRTIELPAGVLGDEDASEDPLGCARRELLEETGCEAASLRILQVSPSAPGLTSEIQYLVLAEGVRRVAAGGGVDGEDIRVHVVTLDAVDAFLAGRAEAGLLVDHRIHAALYHLRAGA